MIEYEVKLMLSKEEYDFIMDVYDSEADSIRQVNYYYDTDGLDMNKKGITCRIRQIGDYLCATMKDHTDGAGGRSEEMSFAVYRVSEVMDFFGFHLRQQGSLVTERTNLKIKADVLATLDKNTYLGTEDYELEIEYQEDNLALAVNILKSIAEMLYSGGVINGTGEFLSRAGAGKSKSARFFDRKESCNCEAL